MSVDRATFTPAFSSDASPPYTRGVFGGGDVGGGTGRRVRRRRSRCVTTVTPRSLRWGTLSSGTTAACSMRSCGCVPAACSADDRHHQLRGGHAVHRYRGLQRRGVRRSTRSARRDRGRRRAGSACPEPGGAHAGAARPAGAPASASRCRWTLKSGVASVTPVTPPDELSLRLISASPLSLRCNVLTSCGRRCEAARRGDRSAPPWQARGVQRPQHTAAMLHPHRHLRRHFVEHIPVQRSRDRL